LTTTGILKALFKSNTQKKALIKRRHAHHVYIVKR
jgi:hypothetical protein